MKGAAASHPQTALPTSLAARKSSAMKSVATVMTDDLPKERMSHGPKKKAGRLPDLSGSSPQHLPVHPWSNAGDEFNDGIMNR
jgi:hypothetical protein